MIIVLILGLVGIDISRPSIELLFYSIILIFLISWLASLVVEKPIEKIRVKIKSKKS
jgi:peptidoglycan/LPS O-acetylase OafA/YrhL